MSSEKSEIKICQNCKKEFTIEPDDFGFYEKIKVPPPTFCPECRFARRMSWRNERALYKRKCDATGENIISIFTTASGYKAYEEKYWWSDKWDPLDYGKDYDFSKPFFKQFGELLKRVPQLALFNTLHINSEYCNYATHNKDCYLFTGGGWNEKLLYVNRSTNSKDSADCYIIEKAEFCYDCLYCYGCYKLTHSSNCYNCLESSFLYNCRNCNNCFGCTNLVSKSYCIWNEQYSKEEYEKKISEMNMGSFKSLQKLQENFKKEIYLQSIHKYAELISCKNVTGDHVRSARNCTYCFDLGGDNTENCHYATWSGFGAKDLFDVGPGAGWVSELVYESVDTIDTSNILGCMTIHNSNNIFYSVNCHSSSNLFGCCGLKKKSYCILNHQYTKAQYEELIPKIIQQMNEMLYIDDIGNSYAYGEFFPAELSPFCYNETIAQEYFPLTKEQALKQGYRWKDRVERNYEIDIKTKDIPDNIKEVNEEIIGKVIECEHKGTCNEQCTEAFKIIESEYQFYQRMNLPIPHLCPNCRHYQRLKQRNPLKLWHRQCMCDKKNHANHSEKCEVEFETSYAPERPEIVYCEKCYQQEVY
ncbi:MAG: hypothetical protein WAN61_02845 [Minisyncoccia bacterium]